MPLARAICDPVHRIVLLLGCGLHLVMFCAAFALAPSTGDAVIAWLAMAVFLLPPTPRAVSALLRLCRPARMTR